MEAEKKAHARLLGELARKKDLEDQLKESKKAYGEMEGLLEMAEEQRDHWNKRYLQMKVLLEWNGSGKQLGDLLVEMDKEHKEQSTNKEETESGGKKSAVSTNKGKKG